MTTKRIFLLMLVVLLAAVLAGCAPSRVGDGIIIGSSYRLAKGETVNNDLAVFGGSVMLEEGSTV